MRLVPQVFDVEAFAWQGWRLFAGGGGLERVLASLWPEVPTQCCTVHKHRNLLAHTPETLHKEITADYNDMISAENNAEVMRRQAVPHQMAAEVPWRRLFTFTRLPVSQWKSARTTDVMDKTFLAKFAIFSLCGRPRGEAWRNGWKCHRAAREVPAGLRRPPADVRWVGAVSTRRRNAHSFSPPVRRLASPCAATL